MNPAQEPAESKPPVPATYHNSALFVAGGMPRIQMSESDIQAQLMNVQEYYKHQQTALAVRFEESRAHLLQEHARMQENIKIAMEKQKEFHQQQQIEKQRCEEQQLARIQNKRQDQQSAVASDEVKARLRDVLINKSLNNLQAATQYPRGWNQTQHHSLDQHSPPTSGLSPPPPRAHPLPFTSPQQPPHHALGQDKPLRKAASEPNIKVRLALKQKMIERRSSPLLKRRDRHHVIKHANQAMNVNAGSLGQDPDSGPNTPPSQATSESLLDKESVSCAFPLQMMSKMVNQSLPNISLAQREAMEAGLSGLGAERDPGAVIGPGGPGGMGEIPEAELRARLAAMYGIPANSPLLTAAAAYPMYSYPAMLEPGAGGNDAVLLAHMRMMEMMAESGGAVPPLGYPALPRGVVGAPGLTRTHSAPLPLPRHLLYQHSVWLQKHEQQLMRHNNPKNYLRQKLQSSILQRAGGQAPMENVDEEAEARIAQEMREMREKEEEEALAMEQMHETARHQRAKQALLHKVTQRSRPHVAPDSLSRAKNYPAVSSSPPIPEEQTNTTGLAYDQKMLKHMCVCGDLSIHEENPRRIEAIYERLHEAGLVSRCTVVSGRKATISEITSCHSEAYALLYGTNPKRLAESHIDPKMFENLLAKFCQLPCGGVGVDCDTTWNESHTPSATRVAVASVVDLAQKVWSAELENGFALVRPPGHHAESTQAMGFCYFNNVAIAAKQLLAPPRDVKRILILDWDVHHGNSTQQVFYADPRVLYISLHRHDDGNFFPGTGAPSECGIVRGEGYNVNIAWSGGEGAPMSDAEYLAAFRTLVMPIAREFDPEIVLVSAGFDGAAGHSPKLGGYEISPACFAYMTEQLKALAGGKLVLALEGGYHLPAVCDCSEMCVRVLLGEKVCSVSEKELLRAPCTAAQSTLSHTLHVQRQHWPCVARYSHLIGCSHAEAVALEGASTVTQQTRDVIANPRDVIANRDVMGSSQGAGTSAKTLLPPPGSLASQQIGEECSEDVAMEESGSEPDVTSALTHDTHKACTQFASLSVVKESDSEDKEAEDKPEEMES